MRRINILLIILLTSFAININAATFTVTKTADTNDGVCDSDCSLREAIAAANGVATDDVIDFAPFVFPPPNTIALTMGELVIAANGKLTINGTGSSMLTVSGNNASRVFSVSANADATINDISVKNGNGNGAIESTVKGGGILNLGKLVINRSVISDNSISSRGGGIHNRNGDLQIFDSTISNNTSSDSGGGISSELWLSMVPIVTLVVKDSFVTSNNAANGGGIYTYNTTVTIDNVDVNDNTSGGGGGISLDGFAPAPSATIKNSEITGNMTGGFGAGGGIVVRRTDTTISNCNISSNTSGFAGGGVYFTEADLTITNSDISSNVSNDGGGMSGLAGAFGVRHNLTVSDTKFSDNNTSGAYTVVASRYISTFTNVTIENNNGGGMHHLDGTASILNSTISDNTVFNAFSTFSGGGILNDTDGIMTIINSTITGNTATGGGGGIRNRQTLTLINATVALNLADSDNNGSGGGGGILNDSGAVTNAQNTIIADNFDNAVSLHDFSGTLASLGYNLIENTTGTTITGITTGNILGMDPMLGALADNGGATKTHALLLGSPAIDKGSAVTVPFAQIDSRKSRKQKDSLNLMPPLVVDQRGMMRPVDQPAIANAVGGDGSDIGAFEALAPTAANVQISGRVLTNNGRGIPRTTIEMADADGNIRFATTNQFGYYKFTNVEVGETYIFNIYAKRYQFAPQIINLNDSITDLNFTPN